LYGLINIEEKKERDMKWKRYVVAVMFLSMVFIIIGCGNADQNTVVSSIPAATNTTTLPQDERPSMPAMDLAAAATKLGVTEQQLTDALGSDSQQRMDFTVAASKLGVTEEALREALGFQEGATFPSGERPSISTIDYAAAAAKLGITEQQLKYALGSDSQQPMNFANAAQILGITEESLREALGFQKGNFPSGVPPTDVLPVPTSSS
jgi:hypothetical protein